MAGRTGRKTPVMLFATLLFFGVVLAFLSAMAEGSPAVYNSMLDIGTVVNAKMKTIAAGAETEFDALTNDIKAIRMADSLPDGFVPTDCNTVSTPDSKYPVYVFFDNKEDAGILYFYTKGDTVSMNPISDMLFAYHGALTDISGISEWDASNVLSFRYAFMNDSSLSDLTCLSNWDTSSLSLTNRMFAYDSALTDISGLANWNTSNVVNMYGMFFCARNLPDALALRKWDTSSVTNMSGMFQGALSLMYIDVSNWNTSNVTTMAGMFAVGDSYKGNGQLREIFGLGELDVSNVTDMTCMFYGAGHMTHYDIAGWNVSKVESMNHMFCDNYSLLFLDLSDWDVSSVKTIYCMFDDNAKLQTIGDVSHWETKSLIDAGGWLNCSNSFVGDNFGRLDLSGWDTTNLKSAGEMFSYTKLHSIDLTGWTFDSITNDKLEGAGQGIFYETGNGSDLMKGMGQMFYHTINLDAVYISQSGLDSFNAAVERGVNTLDMWTGSKTAGFTAQ